jgi:2-methylisocitrate lyase-like PEP mutase family enzyme
MQAVCRQIASRQDVMHTEDKLATLAEVFDLLRYEELVEDERRYGVVGAEPC